MADKLVYTPNDDTQYYLFCRLQLGVKTFGHSTLWTNQLKFNKSLIDVKPTNKKALSQNFED